MPGMIDEEGPVGIGDVPKIVVVGAMVVAHQFIFQNIRKRLTAIVNGLPTFALGAAAGRKFGFGQLMLDQPQT